MTEQEKSSEWAYDLVYRAIDAFKEMMCDPDLDPASVGIAHYRRVALLEMITNDKLTKGGVWQAALDGPLMERSLIDSIVLDGDVDDLNRVFGEIEGSGSKLSYGGEL